MCDACWEISKTWVSELEGLHEALMESGLEEWHAYFMTSRHLHHAWVPTNN